MDCIKINNKEIHKSCFRCSECKNQLTVGKFASLDGKFYCKPHFKQLFSLKGNYTDGFKKHEDEVENNEPVLNDGPLPSFDPSSKSARRPPQKNHVSPGLLMGEQILS
jgi:hypothetical protein